MHTNVFAAHERKIQVKLCGRNLQGDWHCALNTPSMPHPDFQVRELEPVRAPARSYGAEPRPLCLSAGGIIDLPSSTCSS